MNARLESANEAATKAKSARIRARKAGEARTRAEEDLAAANALGDALSAELREREEELRRAEASLAASREETRTVARAERDAASLLLEGKRVWESLERALRDQIDAAEARRLEAESRLASTASNAERRARLAEEEAHELRTQMQQTRVERIAGDGTQTQDVESLRAALQRALADAERAEERASDAEAATRSAEAKIESMRWPKSLTSPDGGTDSDPNGATTTSSLVDRAADQRVATLRWYAAALNSRRASAAKRVASLEADLRAEMKRSEDAKRAMLEAAAGVRQRAMDAEADAAARCALEADLAKTKADLAKARRMNVEGQMTRSSLRIELAEAKASAEALARAMAAAELPTDTPDAHRAREETVKRAVDNQGARGGRRRTTVTTVTASRRRRRPSSCPPPSSPRQRRLFRRRLGRLRAPNLGWARTARSRRARAEATTAILAPESVSTTRRPRRRTNPALLARRIGANRASGTLSGTFSSAPSITPRTFPTRYSAPGCTPRTELLPSCA